MAALPEQRARQTIDAMLAAAGRVQHYVTLEVLASTGITFGNVTSNGSNIMLVPEQLRRPQANRDDIAASYIIEPKVLKCAAIDWCGCSSYQLLDGRLVKLLQT